jgi:lipoate-protein ligase A
VDLEKMFTLLKVPSEKTRKKLIDSAKDRVTSINDVLSDPVTFEEVVSSLADGFERSLGLKFERSELSEEELALADQTASEKYGARDWNQMR